MKKTLSLPKQQAMKIEHLGIAVKDLGISNDLLNYWVNRLIKKSL